MPGRRRTDHLHPRRLRELHQHGAHPAVRTVHQDRLPGPDPRLAVQHLPRGDAVDHHGLGLRRADTVRHRHGVGRLDQHVAGPAADLDQGGDPLPGQAGVHVLAGRQHRADQVVAGHEGERRLVVVAAAAHLLLGERDPGGLRPDQHLAGSRGGDGPVPDLESLRLHLAGQDDLGQFPGDGLGVHGGLRWLAVIAFVRSYNSISLRESIAHVIASNTLD
jgi:hypothetical protein